MIEVVNASPRWADNEKSHGRISRFGIPLFLRRISFWTIAFILDGVQNVDGKFGVKTRSALLVEIFHPGSPQEIFGQKDSRESVNEGEVEGE